MYSMYYSSSRVSRSIILSMFVCYAFAHVSLCRELPFRFPKGILPLSAPVPTELEHLPLHYLAELTFEEVGSRSQIVLRVTIRSMTKYSLSKHKWHTAQQWGAWEECWSHYFSKILLVQTWFMWPWVSVLGPHWLPEHRTRVRGAPWIAPPHSETLILCLPKWHPALVMSWFSYFRTRYIRERPLVSYHDRFSTIPTLTYLW